MTTVPNLAGADVARLAQRAASRLGNRVFGAGLAAAVLADATAVRTMLVPAVLQVPGSASRGLSRRLGRAILSLSAGPDLVHRAGAGLIRPQPVSPQAA